DRSYQWIRPRRPARRRRARRRFRLSSRLSSLGRLGFALVARDSLRAGRVRDPIGKAPYLTDRRQRSIGVFGIGLLLPLLGGGNDLLTLAPDLAIRYFALATIALAGLFAASTGSSSVSTRSAPTVALLVLVPCILAALALRPFGPRAVLESQGIFCAVLI